MSFNLDGYKFRGTVEDFDLDEYVPIGELIHQLKIEMHNGTTHVKLDASFDHVFEKCECFDIDLYSKNEGGENVE